MITPKALLICVRKDLSWNKNRSCGHSYLSNSSVGFRTRILDVALLTRVLRVRIKGNPGDAESWFGPTQPGWVICLESGTDRERNFILLETGNWEELPR